MKNYKNLLIFLVIYLLLVQIVPASDLCEGQNNDFIFVEEEINEQNKELNYEIQASYPVLQDSLDAEIQENFNDTVFSQVDDKIFSFKNDMKDWGQNPEFPMGSSFISGYKIIGVENNIISLQFYNETYYAGAAHPSHLFWSLNYNINNEEEIKLADLFIEKSDYLHIISDFCLEDLAKKSDDPDYEPDKDWIYRGAGPEEENFKCFTLSEDSLVITFNEYQVGPYVEGSSEVHIPYEYLKIILNPEGPLGSLI